WHRVDHLDDGSPCVRHAGEPREQVQQRHVPVRRGPDAQVGRGADGDLHAVTENCAPARLPERLDFGEKERTPMRYFKVLIGVTMAAAVTVALAGCGSESTPATPDARPSGGFMQPAGTVAVSFTVDDTANKVYGPGDLQWKGSMIYDPATRKITKDP